MDGRLLYIVVVSVTERILEILEKKEIKKILKFYKSIYPNSKLSESNLDTVNTWYLMLEDFTYEQVQNAIVKFFKQKNKYMPNLPNIVENIEVPDYTIKKIPPNTVIIQFEDEAYGNFPFRFLNSQDAKEYSKKFQECNYDKESIKILHEEHVRKRNAGVLTYRGEAKARLEQKLQNQNNKGSRRYDKQSSFSW
ncbi:replicative helicase loader/inhibitor [Faecalibacillus intestinalis]|jgi:hypothetical protein|uniref:replicative helicase loader/inhibitor n=2 Tax=Erysipelotrichales TaxID=526525 RepID=UPI0039939323